jgi:RNA polymerase sigma-70 factor (ECF subfamily)
MSVDELDGAPEPRNRFPTTHWSIVLQAGADSTGQARAALERLCRDYWYPLYGYARRHGRAHHEAQDCTQEFLARLLAAGAVTGAQPERGRFRTFLLTALRNFLVNEWHRAQAGKRGGGTVHVPLDPPADVEERFAREPADAALTPEQAFDRNWALDLLEHAAADLRHDYERTGRGALFTLLAPLAWNDGAEESLAELGARAGLTPQASAVALHRLRRRLADRLRERIAETVAGDGDVDTELRHLIAAVSPSRPGGE